MYRKDEIKQALLQGGLIVAPRGSGKSQALAEILLEDPDAVVLVPTEAAKGAVLTRIYDATQDEAQAKDAVARVHSFTERRMDHYSLQGKNLYLDEVKNLKMDLQDLHFKAAVTSVPFPVKVIR